MTCGKPTYPNTPLASTRPTATVPLQGMPWVSHKPQCYFSIFVPHALSVSFGQPLIFAGTMCSYAGLNGVPSCGNDYLLNKVARGHFGRPNLVVGTDCGAVNNMKDSNHYASNAEDAAAKTLNGTLISSLACFR